MITIYNAVSLAPNGSKPLKGGSTKPWLINVRTEKGIKPYVVKLFKKAHIDDYAAVAKEIFASVLAKDLDLQCPEPALIELNETFIKTLTTEEKQDLDSRDSRIKFGSEYIEGTVTYNKVIGRSLLDRYNFENIYAFDNLIRNMDRKPSKPNILISNTQFHLIDHELSLPINLQTLREFDSENWTYNFKNHIFYQYLKSAKSRAKG